MTYVDFFCMPLPENNFERYQGMAENFYDVMKDYGLLDYCEAVADDVPRGEVTDFYRAVAAKEGETVVAAYLIWPDKQARERAWNEGMKDPRLDSEEYNKVFDGKRMFWGGFTPFVRPKQ